MPAVMGACDVCVMHVTDSRELGKHTKYSDQPQPPATEHARQVALLRACTTRIRLASEVA